MPPSVRRLRPLVLALPIAACAVEDARVADRARGSLMGLSEMALESCLGAPDQHASFGTTDVLTYYATSSSSTSYSLPIVGGLGLSNGGYCHATFTVEDGRVTRLLYSGEKNATLAANAYCAPIVRTCLGWLDSHPEARGVAPAVAAPGPATPASSTVPPGAPSGTPQPGAGNAALPANVPSPTPR